jgi:hypothetical protein
VTAAGGQGELDAGFVLPGYGQNTLADLSRSVLASAGLKDEDNVLGLPPAQRVCLLVIDGLGWELLRAHRSAAPFLAGLMETGCWLAAGFPATTVTSLSSLGTGRPPGQHGLLGYQVLVPGTGRLLNGLRWDKQVDPLAWQPGPTIFERAAAAGISPLRIANGAYEKTGLSAASMRGADYWPARTLGALVGRAARALAAAPRALAMVYSGDLDSTGHEWGCSSADWRYQLGHVDLLAQQLAAALPGGTALHITADHGMIDVPPGQRTDADVQTELRAGVAVLGGEPRARHVYAEPGAAADVLATWTEVLADRALVRSRDQAIEAGWFGPVDPRVADRIGDVVAAMAGNHGVIASKAEPNESALIGMHGSLAASDQRVPLLSYLA